ncbi:hypothetical protein [Spiroplasma ixodetis]|uniref:hypothetical protein n=1 Tax=Spiroplasma ixodetis TaxID=2141 RepID=UPI0025783FD1|nr:hypothetical protein [Spiroplasma ixodetis]
MFINKHIFKYLLSVNYYNDFIFSCKRYKFLLIIFKAFLPLCTIFKFYHINAEKSLSTDFSPHF